MFTHMQGKVAKWEEQLECLEKIVLTQPHAAHAAFTHGLSSRWSYLTCTVDCIAPLLEPLETIIRSKLIPALTGQPSPNDDMQDLLALPVRLGGIALTNPTSVADMELSASIKISDPLKSTILQQNFEYSVTKQLDAKSEVRKLKRERSIQAADSLKQTLFTSL